MARKRKQKKASGGRKCYELRSGKKRVPNVKTAAACKRRRSAPGVAATRIDFHYSICLDTNRYKSKAQMPCGHSFHKRRINSWVKVSQSCPICRKPVKDQQQSTSQQFRVEVTEQPESSDPMLSPMVTVVLAALVPLYRRSSRYT